MLEAYYDGSCNPINPGGHGTWGAWIRDAHTLEVLQTLKGYCGHGKLISNNVAEYAGMIGALEWLLREGHAGTPIVVHGDSMLTIMQVTKRWKAKSGLYLPYYKRAMELIPMFEDINFQWIPRRDNATADELSRVELKARGIKERW